MLEWGVAAKGYGASFWGNENVLKLDSRCCLQICENTKKKPTKLYTFSRGNFIVRGYLNKADIKT